jgi:hypothetical protein
MRTHWEGAKDGCTGVMLEEEHRERQRRYEANQKMKRARAAGTAEPATGTERTSR